MSFGRIILLLFSISVYFTVAAQEAGKPYIKNFSPKAYKGTPQNWAVIQDHRGLVYVGNTNQGIYEYDGTTWRHITNNPSEQNTVRSFSIDSSGVIYVGAKADFGVLLPDSKGKLKYLSFKNKIAEKDQDFSDIFKTYTTEDGVFFQSFQSLILWKNGKYKIWYPEKNTSFHLSFYVNNVLYIRERGSGLKYLKNDQLISVPGGEKFSEERIFTMLPFDKDKILIGTQTQGVYFFDTKNNVFSKDPAYKNVDDFIIENALYQGLVIDETYFAFSTFNGGVLVFDKKGNIRRIIDKRAGLQDEFVYYSYSDYQKNLWFGLNNGVSKAEISSQFSSWDESLGLKGGVTSICMHKETLYATTDLGVFYLEKGMFRQVQGINSQCWNVCSVKIPLGKTTEELLLVAAGTGVYEISNNSARHLFSHQSCSKLLQSKKNPKRVFIGCAEGLSSIIFNNGQWKDEGKINKTFRFKEEQRSLDKPVRSIQEDVNGNLWLGTDDDGFYKIKFWTDTSFSTVEFPYITLFDSAYFEKGNRKLSTYRVFNYGEKLLFATEGGLFEYDSVKTRFYPSDILEKNTSGVYIIAGDNSGNLFFSLYDKDSQWIEMYRTKDNKLFPDTISFNRLKDLYFESIYCDTAGQVWIGCNNGIFQFDNSIHKDFNVVKPSLIRKVTIGRDSVIFWGTFYTEIKSDDSIVRKIALHQSEQMIPSIDYAYNSITFNFSYPGYEDESANIFSFYLEGYKDEKWSDWTSDPKKDYTNLDPGTYVFHVRAKNIYGIVSPEITYKFIVFPPWYRTWWAFLIYIILAFIVVYAIAKINTYRLLKEKQRLEQIVKERTAEVVKQKEEIQGQHDQLVYLNTELQQQKEEIETQRDEIEGQRDEIVEQKKEITDSIHYAKRIQTAILPPEEYVTKSLPEHFILFKPRDIVSGDFYWAKYYPPMRLNEKGKYIAVEEETASGLLVFCVADCTGHGVPGAFMSMLGTAFLNEITNAYPVESIKNHIKASEVLDQLRDLIINSLHQTGKSGEQKDGMDITMCILDLDPVRESGEEEKYKLQVAGANNSLYVVRKEKYLTIGEEPLEALEEVNPDKMPIGIFGGTTRPFSNNLIELKKGDMIYLTSDGYPDQFGGPKGKKFMYKQLKKLFVTISQNPTHDQKEILNNTIEEWKNGATQIDDIAIMGMRI